MAKLAALRFGRAVHAQHVIELQDALEAAEGAMRTVTYAATISLDVSRACLFKTTTVHATGNATINAAAVGSGGRRIWIKIENDATSGKVITFGTNFRPSGTLTGTISKAAVVGFISDETSWLEISRATGL